MKIALISGGFPPQLDGIGDYTWWLARQLTLAGHEVSVFTSHGPERTPPPGVKVVPCFDPARLNGLATLGPAISSAYPTGGPEWVILQYNPFGFGKRGFCPLLPGALRHVQRTTKAKIALMFHETMVPNWPWKFALMRSWQLPTFRSICRLADVAFVSTARWIPQVRNANAALPCHHLPVGSNVDLIEIDKTDARQRIGLTSRGLVAGVFGQAHPSRLFDWIGAAACRLEKTHSGTSILYVGPGGQQLRAACPGVEIIDAGVQPANQTGLYLRAADLILSPFSDGVSTRRTSAITPFQHGIPTATTKAEWTDRLLLESAPPSILLSGAATAEDFSADVVRWWASCGQAFQSPDPKLREFYESYFSWPSMVSLMLKKLAERPTS